MPNEVLEHSYRWTRRWRERLKESGSISYTAYTFGEIFDTPCLVVLGEPGMGKSHALTQEHERVKADLDGTEDVAELIDLHPYSSEFSLFRDLFDADFYQTWARGSHCLHLFLDSLDESQLRIRQIGSLLVSELAKLRQQDLRERLRVRIVCRTADWRTAVEDELRRLWEWGGNGDGWVRPQATAEPPSGVEDYEVSGARWELRSDSGRLDDSQSARLGVYEIAPLEREDVKEAARENELNPDTFWEAVRRADAVPLAEKPVTLEFLLREYRQWDEFPRSQAELYVRGCTLLCTESNPARRGIEHTNLRSPEERVVVAARIAARTIFCNQQSIWMGPGEGEAGELTLQDLTGGGATYDGTRFDVREAAVREVLARGLFSSRGPDRLGWAQQTYAGFLAAHYLLLREMTLPQMMSLITHPDGTLVPQLHETAA